MRKAIEKSFDGQRERLKILFRDDLKVLKKEIEFQIRSFAQQFALKILFQNSSQTQFSSNFYEALLHKTKSICFSLKALKAFEQDSWIYDFKKWR